MLHNNLDPCDNVNRIRLESLELRHHCILTEREEINFLIREKQIKKDGKREKKSNAINISWGMKLSKCNYDKSALVSLALQSDTINLV